MWDANLDMCALTGRSSRKSMASNSRNSNVQAKVSAWRDPKDKPQRQSTNAQAATPARAGPQYEGPDQQLAEQLERWAQYYSTRHISMQLHWLNKIACIEIGLVSQIYSWQTIHFATSSWNHRLSKIKILLRVIAGKLKTDNDRTTLLLSNTFFRHMRQRACLQIISCVFCCL